MNFVAFLNLLYFTTAFASVLKVKVNDIVSSIKDKACGFSNDNFLNELHLDLLCSQPKLSITDLEYKVNYDLSPLLCMQYEEVNSNFCNLKEENLKTNILRDKETFKKFLSDLETKYKDIKDFCNSTKNMPLKFKNSSDSNSKSVDDLFKSLIGEEKTCVRLCSKFDGRSVSDLCNVIIWAQAQLENVNLPANETTGYGKSGLILSGDTRNQNIENTENMNRRTNAAVNMGLVDKNSNDNSVAYNQFNNTNSSMNINVTVNQQSLTPEVPHTLENIQPSSEASHIQRIDHTNVLPRLELPKNQQNNEFSHGVENLEIQQKQQTHTIEQQNENGGDKPDVLSENVKNDKNKDVNKGVQNEKSTEGIIEKPGGPESTLNENGNGNENNPDSLPQLDDTEIQEEDALMSSVGDKQLPEAGLGSDVDPVLPSGYRGGGNENLMVNEDSRFFTYFVPMGFVCGVMYLLFHNKKKILALAVEGRRGRSHGGGRRRPNTASYSKLDCNLEEAMVSNVSQASVTHVLY